MKIPKRLFQIYSLAEGNELWDIGCDHSLLARINLQEKKFSKVYCVDKSKSSLAKIINETGAVDRDRIVLVQTDGCLLDWSNVHGTVVIAGVGGNTVIKVVQSCPEPYRRKLTWVLNPFTSVDRFLIEMVQYLPDVAPQRFEAKENGRTRYIFRYPAAE